VSPSETRQRHLVWWGVFLSFAALYLLTTQRGVGWQDSGIFQYRILQGVWYAGEGLARAHPLYTALGRLILRLPLGAYTWRLNALSGIGMALAVANLAAILLELESRPWVAVAGAAILGVAHTPWWLATIAEVYTLGVAGLTLEILLLLRLIDHPRPRTAIALALVCGLGFSLHNLALVGMAVYGLVGLILLVQRRLPLWVIPAAAGAFAVGGGLLVSMIVQQALETGLWPAIHSALFGIYASQVMTVLPSLGNLRNNLALTALNFGSLLLPLLLWGIWRAKERVGRTKAAALIGLFAIELLFVIRYDVPDQFTFMLPTLATIAVLAGIGLDDLADRRPRLAWSAALVSILLPPLLYGLIPLAAHRLGIDLTRARALPYRDEMRYWVTPWKHNETSAQRFAQEALAQVAPDGILIADWTTIDTLRVQQTLTGEHPEVAIYAISRWRNVWQNGSGESDPYRLQEEHGIWIVSPVKRYAPSSILHYADTEQEGVLYRVTLHPEVRAEQ